MCRTLQNNPNLSYISLLLFSTLVLKIHGILGKHWLIQSFFFFFVLLLWVSKFQHYCSSTIQVIMSLLETKYRGRLIVCLFIVYFSQEPKEILDLFLYFVGTKKLPEISECMSTWKKKFNIYRSEIDNYEHRNEGLRVWFQ